MLLIAILLCVSVVSINADQCSDASATLATCLLPLSGTAACTCWNNYKSAAGSCSSVYYEECTVAKAICTDITDCSLTVNDCASAVAQLSICTATNPTSACNCISTFKSQASQYCTQPADSLLSLTTCEASKALCSTGSCEADCQNLIGNIPGCQSTYDSCTAGSGDKCACYTALATCMAAFDVCDDVKVTQLKACVSAQFDCVTLKGTCDSSEYSIDLSDAQNIFTEYKSQFISLWNQNLTSLAATIQNCDQSTAKNIITWTLTLDYNATLCTLDVVAKQVVEQFAQTIGISVSQLKYDIKSYGAKRSLQSSTGTVEVTATGSGNGSSMVSVFLLPIVLFNGLMFLFFH